MTKEAATLPLHEFITGRRSPRNYLDRAVEPQALLTLLEAARRAASSANRQPWNFIVAPREDAAGFERLLGCLLPGNQSWAGAAPVLMLVVAAVQHEGRPARTSFYDTGLAMGNLTVQAMATGLMLRQMGGIDRARARQVYDIPGTHEPICAVALGWPAPPETLPEKRRAFELEPQLRKPLPDFVFGERWGRPADFL